MQKFGEPLVSGVDGVGIYVDDIFSGARSLEGAVAQWREVLSRCRTRSVYLAKDKLRLFRNRLEILGHLVLAGVGWSVLPDRAQDILRIQDPSNVQELERVVGIFS